MNKKEETKRINLLKGIYIALRTYMKGKYQERTTFTGTLIEMLFGKGDTFLLNKIVLTYHDDGLKYSIRNEDGLVEKGKLKIVNATKTLIGKVKKVDKKGLFKYEDSNPELIATIKKLEGVK